MNKIALIGAGGKMGVRLAANLRGSRYEVSHVEVSPEGRKRLSDAVSVECVDMGTAAAGAEAAILAVPDKLIGKVSREIAETLDSGAALVVLDAAAPHAGEMPGRDDIAIFVTHPCHPPLFAFETAAEAQRDFFGGAGARQNIVCALMRGPEEIYPQCEELARTIYAPVDRATRCTVEQIAILEPALSETVSATLCYALRDATEEAIRRGVPRQAAVDFILGHLKIELAIAFGAFPEGKFSDGALQAIESARPKIFRDGWLDRIFDPDAVLESVKEICEPWEPQRADKQEENR